MAITGLIGLGLRGLQFLFGVVILGLSITLIRGHHWGSLPASLGYAAFVGGLTILGALVGIAGTFVSFLEGIVGMAFDGLVAILSIIGGIIMAIKLKGVSCKWDLFDEDNMTKLGYNEFFNGGTMKIKGEWYAWVTSAYGQDEGKIKNVVLGHCREAQADLVFMFMVGVVCIATALMLFLKKRKGY